MSVELEHLVVGSTQAVIVRGVDSVQAVTHLCHALESGGGPLETLVILDLTNAAVAAQAALPTLRRTAESMSHAHRWLGVVEPMHASAAAGEGWYRTAGAALAAGRSYAALTAGDRNIKDRLNTTVSAAAGILSWLGGLVGGQLARGRRR